MGVLVESKMENPASIETSDFMTGTCREEQWWASLYIDIQFDNHPEDITWELRDTCRERLIEFTIKDANGDGLCCTQGDGGYEIFYALDGFPGPTVTSKMEGVAEEKQYFGLEEHCPQFPDDPDGPVCRSVSSFEKTASGRGRTRSKDLLKRIMNQYAELPDLDLTDDAACYDFENHKCKCTAELCDMEKRNSAEGHFWTRTCVPTDSTPVDCTCDDF